jgi:threonine/homoserine/homoserine lactone efflux protein
MTLAELLGFVVILAAATAVPGPDIAAIVGRALGVGFGRTLPMIAGIVIGHAGWMLAACLGLATLALALGPAFVVIKIAAVLYLLYLAWQLWRAPVEAAAVADAEAAAARAPLGSGLAAGLLVSLSNAKAMVLFGAVLPSVVPVERLGGTQIAVLIAANSLTMLAVFLAWAAAMARARALLVNAARRRALNRTSAVVLAGTGIAVAVR